jgi:hypothetical protein
MNAALDDALVAGWGRSRNHSLAVSADLRTGGGFAAALQLRNQLGADMRREGFTRSRAQRRGLAG